MEPMNNKFHNVASYSRFNLINRTQLSVDFRDSLMNARICRGKNVSTFDRKFIIFQGCRHRNFNSMQNQNAVKKGTLFKQKHGLHI